jgi:hypothetical protein
VSRGFFLIAAIALALPAKAELYRWVDRESGSVKYSNTPPPWYGDPDKERGAPAVEVLRYRAPGKPPAADAASPASRQTASLEARRAELLKFFSALPPTTDLANPAIREQVQSYLVVSAELDRLDPAGASRRRAQIPPIFEALAGRRAR